MWLQLLPVSLSLFSITVMAETNLVLDTSRLGHYAVEAVLTNRTDAPAIVDWGVTFTGEFSRDIITQVWQSVTVPALSAVANTVQADAPPLAWCGRVELRQPTNAIAISSVRVKDQPLKSVWDIPRSPAAHGDDPAWRGAWIVADEARDPKEYATIAPKSYRYFTREFEVVTKPRQAILVLAADDQSRIWLNGQEIGKTLVWQEPGRFDVTPQVRAGQNLLSVELFNDTAYYALVAELKITHDDGKTVHLGTDASWRVGTTKPDRWPLAPAPDVAKVYAQVGDAPWGSLAAPAWEGVSLAGPSDLPAVARPTFPTARVKPIGGRPQITVNGKLISGMQYFESQSSGPGVVERLGRHGIQILDVNIGDFGWKGDGLYDFSEVDRRLQKALNQNPNTWLMVVFDVGTSWWPARHPEAAALGPTGQPDLEAYHGTKGVFPCYVHPLWRTALQDALEQLVRHLAASPLGQRIIGFRPCNGISWEWFYWGSQSEQFADYNPAMRDAYRQWLAAQKIDDPAASIPTPDEWRRSPPLFRDPAASANVIRFARFWQEMVADTLDWMCAIIKCESKGRVLAGSYYGYTLHLAEAGHFGQLSGHFALTKLLRSPQMDMFYAPTDGYSFRGIGETGGMMVPAGSLALHNKLYFSEADFRTHWSAQDLARTKTIAEDVAIFRREFALSLATRADIEWYDFSQAYQAGDERLVREMGRLQQARTQLGKRDMDFRPHDLAVITGEDIELQDLASPPLAGGLLYQQRPEFFRAGLRHHYFLSSDLANPALRRFKCLLFLNCWKFSDAQRAAVNQLKSNGRTLIFVYAPGAWDGRDLSPRLLSELTGFSIERAPTNLLLRAKWSANGTEFGLPFANRTPVSFLPKPDGQTEILATSLDGTTSLLVRRVSSDWTSVFSAVPHLSPEVIRELTRAAGLHIYCESDDACYPAPACLGLHARTAGLKTVALPARKKRVFDLLTNQTLGTRTDKVTFSAEAQRTYLIGWE